MKYKLSLILKTAFLAFFCSSAAVNAASSAVNAHQSQSPILIELGDQNLSWCDARPNDPICDRK